MYIPKIPTQAVSCKLKNTVITTSKSEMQKLKLQEE